MGVTLNFAPRKIFFLIYVPPGAPHSLDGILIYTPIFDYNILSLVRIQLIKKFLVILTLYLMVNHG